MRLKVLETDRLTVLLTVTVMETPVPGGTHDGAVQITSLVMAVLEGTPTLPMLAVHEKLSGDDSWSWAIRRKMTVFPPST
jgi:hypothetical protein